MRYGGGSGVELVLEGDKTFASGPFPADFDLQLTSKWALGQKVDSRGNPSFAARRDGGSRFVYFRGRIRQFLTDHFLMRAHVEALARRR
jgi:hypothetical protein